MSIASYSCQELCQLDMTCFLQGYDDDLYLPGLTHSFPSLRSPDLICLKENRARELLELHTRGGGHSQADAQELARALTGWTVGGPRPFDEVAPLRGRFAFQPEAHEPGGRTCLGKRYPEGGEEQIGRAHV